MRLTADLHIHSHYSRATSKNLNFPNLAKWAQLKGVNIVGTGDISHPGWLAEMHENLEPAEPGLFRLKAGIAQTVEAELPASCRKPVRFLLAGEISSIYKKGDKTRKVHNVIFAPSLEAVAKIQVELEKIGNIRSDGRPILGPAFPRLAGNYPGCGRTLSSHPRPHLDTLVLDAGLKIGLRFGGRVL